MASTHFEGFDLGAEIMKKICVACPNDHTYSETFIRDQVKWLGPETLEIYGGWKPCHSAQTRSSIMKNGLGPRIYRKLMRDLRFKNQDQFIDAAIEGYLIKNKVTGVLANYGPMGVNLLEICKKINIPMVVHFHGFDLWENDCLAQYGGLYPRLFEGANAVIVGATDMVEQIKSLGCPSEKIKLIPCGIDYEIFYPKNDAIRNRQFVAIGRFVPKKAPENTVMAFSMLAKKYSDARLVMIGEGERQKACIELTKSLGIQNQVSFLGPLKSVEVRAVLQTSFAFIQHSIRSPDGDAEGTGISILEAASSGLPAVATRHSGMKDTIIDGETGFLVDEGDIRGMSEKMIMLLENEEMCRSMGQKARARVIQNYDVRMQIQKISNLFD